jgi:hypothetical protein
MKSTAVVDCVWNVMAHAQKPDLVFQGNGRVHLNLPGESVQLTTGSQGVRISGSNAGYTMFWGSVKSIGYPLHSPVSPSLPLPCLTVCHHISTGLYLTLKTWAVSVLCTVACSNVQGPGIDWTFFIIGWMLIHWMPTRRTENLGTRRKGSCSLLDSQNVTEK